MWRPSTARGLSSTTGLQRQRDRLCCRSCAGAPVTIHSGGGYTPTGYCRRRSSSAARGQGRNRQHPKALAGASGAATKASTIWRACCVPGSLNFGIRHREPSRSGCGAGPAVRPGGSGCPVAAGAAGRSRQPAAPNDVTTRRCWRWRARQAMGRSLTGCGRVISTVLCERPEHGRPGTVHVPGILDGA